MSVVDACRVQNLAPPGPPRYVPLEDVAELFSARLGQFAGEGVFVEPFADALVELARRDRTLLGDVFDATRAAVKERGVEQEPELAHGQRELVLRSVAAVGVRLEAWDGVGAGRRLDGASVTLAGRRATSPATFDGLRAGAYRVRVEHPGYVARDLTLELGADSAGRTLRVPLLPTLVLVTGWVTGGAGARVRFAAGRPEGTIDGYHLLDAQTDAEGLFELRLPSIPPGAELLVERGGASTARLLPAAPTGEEKSGELRVPRFELGRVDLGP